MVLFRVVLLLFVSIGVQAIECFYLTFPGDPSQSMAVHYITSPSESGFSCDLRYRSLGETTWNNPAEVKKEPFGKYTLHQVALNALAPDAWYEFSLGKEEKIYRFRTLPILGANRTLTVAVGGDVCHHKNDMRYEDMLSQISKKDPDFVVLGGDIAYANQGQAIERYMQFLRSWCKTMRSLDGRVIPVVATVGNHEILPDRQGRGQTFLQLFPYLQEKSYGRITVPGLAHIYLLDTGHIAPIIGAQTQWLQRALQETKTDKLHTFVVYHVAAYPSVYSYRKKKPTQIRKYWCPLFEEGAVSIVFENHNHAFKRTFPIRKEKVDSSGVVYIGDGCLGVSPRKPSTRWYLEKKGGHCCFSLLTLTPSTADVTSFDMLGREVDQWRSTGSTYDPD